MSEEDIIKVSIQRYDNDSDMGVPVMYEYPDGKWVRFEDVVSIVRKAHEEPGSGCTDNDCGCDLILQALGEK